MMESLAKVLSGNFSTDTATSQQPQQKQEKNDRSSSSLPGRASAVHSATNSSDRSKGTEKDGYLLRNDAPEVVSLTVQVGAAAATTTGTTCVVTAFLISIYGTTLTIPTGGGGERRAGTLREGGYLYAGDNSGEPEQQSRHLGYGIAGK